MDTPFARSSAGTDRRTNWRQRRRFRGAGAALMAGSGLVGGCLLTACQPVPGLPLPPGQLQQQDQSAPAGRDPRCEASYPDDCLYFDPALRDSDYDCWGGTGNGPRYVDHPLRVVYNVDRPDPFGLDRNQNRIGCKSAVASPAPSTPQP